MNVYKGGNRTTYLPMPSSAPYAHISSEAQFIVPDWGDKVDYGIGLLHTVLSGYMDWRAGTTTLCHSRLFPPIRDYEFGYCTLEQRGGTRILLREWRGSHFVIL
jgi:hypothetical protein